MYLSEKYFSGIFTGFGILTAGAIVRWGASIKISFPEFDLEKVRDHAANSDSSLDRAFSPRDRIFNWRR
mgnify:CR=1 FL=1